MRPLAVSFAGERAEYTRLARRNLAMNVLLTGFYTPIAKRRAAEWFTAHTRIDGTPIELVPVTRSRWPVLVVLVLFIALRLATDLGVGPPLPVVVLVGMVLLPYFWGATAGRRVNGVRWRGVQLHWQASWTEIYRASWPLFVIGLPWAFIAPHVAGIGVAPLAALAVAAYPLLVRLAFNYKRLLVTRTWAGEHPVLSQPSFARFVRIWTTSVLAFAASVFPVVLAFRYAMFGTLAAPAELTGWPVIAVSVTGALLAIVVSTPVRAWHEARMFKLLFDGLRVGGVARFECTLDARRFAWLRGRFDKHRAKAKSVTLWVTDEEKM